MKIKKKINKKNLKKKRRKLILHDILIYFNKYFVKLK